MNLRDGIIETANALGMQPHDLATIISYETAGTFDPRKKGPTTQWGQHEGLIQFGQPQQRNYGVDLSSPEAAIASQLGANGAIAKYFRGAGFEPGMGLLDAYSAVNAGRVGRYNASDANNGGAPGTVRDKVENQMSGHAAKAAKLLGGDYIPQGASNPAPQQGFKYDPSTQTGFKPAVDSAPASTPEPTLAGALGELGKIMQGFDKGSEAAPPVALNAVADRASAGPQINTQDPLGMEANPLFNLLDPAGKKLLGDAPPTQPRSGTGGAPSQPNPLGAPMGVPSRNPNSGGVSAGPSDTPFTSPFSSPGGAHSPSWGSPVQGPPMSAMTPRAMQGPPMIADVEPGPEPYNPTPSPTPQGFGAPGRLSPENAGAPAARPMQGPPMSAMTKPMQGPPMPGYMRPDFQGPPMPDNIQTGSVDPTLPETAPIPTSRDKAKKGKFDSVGFLGALGDVMAGFAGSGGPELKIAGLNGVFHKPDFQGLPIPRGLLG